MVQFFVDTLASQSWLGTYVISSDTFVGTCIVLMANIFSALAGVCNEYLLKDVDKNRGFWEKSLYLYGAGMVINVVGSLIEDV